MLSFAQPTIEGLPHRTLSSTQPLQKDNNPSPCTTTLASLVKGEVLSPERIRATTGGIAFLPHPFRFSDTSVNNPSIVGSASHCNRSSPLHKGAKGDSALPIIPNPHYPTLSTTFLPYERSAGFASALSHSLFVGRVSVCAWLALRPLQSWSFAVGASCTDFLRPLVSIRA